jgi:nucleoside-triphosphatase THEP1
MVIVLTGPVHAGKTTFLERACRRWSERGLSCAGFLSPAVTDADGGSGYDLLELPGGVRRPYLRRRKEPGAERTGPFVFVAGALERARSILRDSGPAGLLIVDEVGPLELRGGGLWAALSEAARRPERTALLVVRDAIVGELFAALAPLVPVVFDVRDPEDRRLLDERVLAGLTHHDDQS